MSGYQPLFQAADQFIRLANELAQADSNGNVGAALRFAAARYSAFEAANATGDLSADKARFLESIGEDFRLMLGHNLDDYIRHLAEQGKPSGHDLHRRV